MLERALHSEVDAYLGRRRYDRADDDFSGYRNGYAREREISIGTWAVEVRPPRVADTPAHIPPFRILDPAARPEPDLPDPASVRPALPGRAELG